MIRYITIGAFALVVYLSFRDITSNDAQVHSESHTDVPVPHMKRNFMEPTLKFMFCYSCGYRRAFEEFSTVLRERYPQLKIEGENYQPSAVRALSAQALSYLKLIIIALIVSGQSPFPRLGLNTPGILTWAQQNKIYACVMVFFLSNAIESQLISTGAFEVIFNDIPIWSKLEAGRIPSPQELVQIIDSHLNLNSPQSQRVQLDEFDSFQN